MTLPELFALIYGGIIPALVALAILVNLTANNIVDNHARANGKAPLARQRTSRGVRR